MFQKARIKALPIQANKDAIARCMDVARSAVGVVTRDWRSHALAIYTRRGRAKLLNLALDRRVLTLAVDAGIDRAWVAIIATDATATTVRGIIAEVGIDKVAVGRVRRDGACADLDKGDWVRGRSGLVANANLVRLFRDGQREFSGERDDAKHTAHESPQKSAASSRFLDCSGQDVKTATVHRKCSRNFQCLNRVLRQTNHVHIRLHRQIGSFFEHDVPAMVQMDHDSSLASREVA
jgi:hypothetical protein